jgi:hypothetical protein
MQVKTTVNLLQDGEVYIAEAELTKIIEHFVRGALKARQIDMPPLTVDNLDWDISQGSLMKGVFIKWSGGQTQHKPELEIPV